MLKISSLTLHGIRGVNKTFQLEPKGRSLLIYGNNATGKSSVTDGFEWLLHNRIGHLSNEEVPSTRGRGALRNRFLTDEEAYVAVEFSSNGLHIKKSIARDFRESFSFSDSETCRAYLDVSQSETLILRYGDLLNFVIQPKTDRLNELQSIIGFTEVASLRNLLGKSYRRVSRQMRESSKDGSSEQKQSILMKNLGQPAHNDDQFNLGVCNLLKEFDMEVPIENKEDVSHVLKALAQEEGSETVNEINVLRRAQQILQGLSDKWDRLALSYLQFKQKYLELVSNRDKIRALRLLKLLTEGKEVLETGLVEQGLCPLCLQPKRTNELARELEERIETLREISEQKKELLQVANDLRDKASEEAGQILMTIKDPIFVKEDYGNVLERMKEVQKLLQEIGAQMEIDVSMGGRLIFFDDIKAEQGKISAVASKVKQKADALERKQAGNKKLDVYRRLFQSVNAYNDYRKLKKKRDALSRQQRTLEILYLNLIERQKSALSDFLTSFSNEIDAFYTAMHPGENINEFKLVPVKGKEDELAGLTIEFSFHNEKANPPSAYLSESHLNCLGLAFFLASVRAFNKQSGFFILDDVISSYDKGHRARFAQLIANKFEDYQVWVLTHERAFFEMMRSQVRGKNWSIHELEWSPEIGVCVAHESHLLRDQILAQLNERRTRGLGNLIRKYLERKMKEIACNLEAKVIFQFNETNEKRMVSELFDSVQATIKKKSPGLAAAANIPNLKGIAMFVSNSLSHDSSFDFHINDLKVVWEKIDQLLSVFYCSESRCGTCVATKYYDPQNELIHCKCGNLSYPWKR